MKTRINLVKKKKTIMMRQRTSKLVASKSLHPLPSTIFQPFNSKYFEDPKISHKNKSKLKHKIQDLLSKQTTTYKIYIYITLK